VPAQAEPRVTHDSSAAWWRSVTNAGCHEWGRREWAAVLNAQRGASNVVFLTLLGGGAFGNQHSWIVAAMRRALELMTHFDLDVRLVSYGTPSKETLAIVEKFC